MIVITNPFGLPIPAIENGNKQIFAHKLLSVRANLMSYYNTTDDSIVYDAPHITRLAVDVVCASFCVVVCIILSCIVCSVAKKNPLKAHGYFYLFVKLASTCFVSLFVAVIVPANRLILALCISITPFVYAFPTTLRYFTIGYLCSL